MRTGIAIIVSAEDRRRLASLVKDGNTPQKHAWWAEIVLLSAEGLGTNAQAPAQARRVLFPR
jgi:hypothetical protein